MAFFGHFGPIFGLFWVIFGHFWIQGPIQNNFIYWISCAGAKLQVSGDFWIFSFFDLFLGHFVKFSCSQVWAQVREQGRISHQKSLNVHNLGSDFGKNAIFGPYRGFFCHFWVIFGHFWVLVPIWNNFLYQITSGEEKLAIPGNF